VNFEAELKTALNFASWTLVEVINNPSAVFDALFAISFEVSICVNFALTLNQLLSRLGD
jgi:hypothetical protein